MRFEKSRKALILAERHYGLLVDSATDSSESFRIEFVCGIAMIRRVGSILNDEIRANRPENAMLDWWRGTLDDDLLVFIKDVRDDEFKGGEDRKSAHHFISVSDSAGATDSATVGLQATVNLKVQRANEPVENLFVTTTGPEPQAKEADGPPREEPARHRIEWRFTEGAYKGEEVIPTVREYLDRMSALIEQAEERLSI